MRDIELVDPSETGPGGAAIAPDTALTKHAVDALRKNPVIFVGDGRYYKNVIGIQLPLVVEQAELNRFTSALRKDRE